jgi:hypothetical protein
MSVQWKVEMEHRKKQGKRGRRRATSAQTTKLRGTEPMKGMMVFYQLFPEIGLKETRTAAVFGRDSSLPDDSYGFIELYCVDPACDCRRVMINVLAEKQRTHLATINHAFEPHADDDPVQEQTFLDPLNVQSRWSGALLGLFKEILLDEAYRERLDRHYRMVKDALRDPVHPIHQVISGSRRPSAPRHKT